MTRASGYLAAAALLSLVLGTLVYALGRPVPPALFSGSRGGTLTLLGAAGAWLPSLAHAFAFTLLSALALGLSRRALVLSCALWAGLELAFELGQHPAVSSFLDHTGLGLTYFRFGTFDVLDVTACLVGIGLAALVTLRFTRVYA